MSLIDVFAVPDAIAFCLFLLAWGGYALLSRQGAFGRVGLGQRMNAYREAWMRTLLRRDLRMIDTSIMAGLQQGTGFFASSCIFAIGGCFALMGSAEHISRIAADLPVEGLLDRRLVETKLLGLILIFAHAFFQFGWAYRLFNYCSILIGAIPMRADAEADPETAEASIQRALAMNRIAGRHFNAGLRTIFFGLAYLGWFLGPYVLMLTTVSVFAVLTQRQFSSDAHDAVANHEKRQ